MNYKCPAKLQAMGPNACIPAGVMCRQAPGPSFNAFQEQAREQHIRFVLGTSLSNSYPRAQHLKAVGFVVLVKAFFALFLIYSKSQETFSCCFLQSPEPAQKPHTEDKAAAQSQISPQHQCSAPQIIHMGSKHHELPHHLLHQLCPQNVPTRQTDTGRAEPPALIKRSVVIKNKLKNNDMHRLSPNPHHFSSASSESPYTATGSQAMPQQASYTHSADEQERKPNQVSIKTQHRLSTCSSS